MIKILACVRGVDESSADDCIGQLKQLKFDVSVDIDSRSLEQKERDILLLGDRIKGEYDWIMTVDADTIITLPKEEIEKRCEDIEINTFSFCGVLVQTHRHRMTKGVRFYRTSMCGLASELIDGVNFCTNPPRASKYLLKYLTKKGFTNITHKRGEKPLGIHLWYVNNKINYKNIDWAIHP